MASGSQRSSGLARQQRAVANDVNALYRLFKHATHGADGATGAGVNGSIRADGLVKILLRMRVKDKHVLDLGAGEGRVLLAAWLAGCGSVASGWITPVS